MPTVTQAVASFLAAKRSLYAGTDCIADRWTPDLETQINVSSQGGEPLDGKPSTFTDGVREWWHIRMPKDADSEPHFNDYELTWPLSQHAEAIGSTGWDFRHKVSRWVGFDFDAITGHGVGVGISAEELAAVKDAACAVPWVEVRNSTGGKGIHLYVSLSGVQTANHTEHAALARAVLGILSTEAGFDFASQIDACGGNMWLWHRKLSFENQGLMLVKAPTETFNKLPPNWRDHLDVVTRKRKKIRVTDDNEFEALVTSRKFVPLDAKHKAVIEALQGINHPAVWVPDHHCLQTHTNGLAELCNDIEHRNRLGIRGFFQTTSSGSSAINCFLMPLADGAWKVCRFTRGLAEHETWQQDGIGWTWCFFNRLPDLKAACLANSGVELPDGKGFEFAGAFNASQAARALGASLDIPSGAMNRKVTLRANKDGRLVASIEGSKEEQPPATGYTYKRGGHWMRVFGVTTGGAHEDENELDDVYRVAMTPSGEPAGDYIANAGGTWDMQSNYKVRCYLQSKNYPKNVVDKIIGDATCHRWEKVCLPFQGEYPGGRRWNLNAPQLRCPPALSRDGLVHPHWDRIFNHCGHSLTPYLGELEWARSVNICTGGDYLRAWFAVLLREPFARLPYLFLYGPEKTGKSTLWMAARDCLVTKGVVKVDRALKGDFDGELEGAILGVIEEINLSKTPGAQNKIKDVITGTEIAIHKKFCTPYNIANTLHLLHTANSWDAAPIADGDTRFTVFDVQPFTGTQIPWGDLVQLLTAETPAFLRTLLDMELPTQVDRLRIPVVETEQKRQIAIGHRNELEQFIAEQCFQFPSARVTTTEFFERFQQWLPERGKAHWHRQRVTRELPFKFPRGRGGGNVHFICGLQFSEEPPLETIPWVQSGDRVKLQGAA